ncbi:H-NS family nucleoid-associated regulatory protein [Paraburkholderia sediminicola]|uniref:H-NS family nucleoid-associated regulatory protein n=1 Tax=Paraburkholderia rhynchosiae TaxID=487049 RepID=A0ACC7NIW1_9BURK
MATLEQIEAKMKNLKTQAEALAAKKTQAVVDQIRDIMSKHGLTTADIEAKTSAKRATKGQKVSAAAGKTKNADVTKAKAAPKYQHPKTGATWTGHGRAPAWIAEAKNRNRFLISGAAEVAVAANAGVVSRVKTAVNKTASKSVGATGGKGQPKGPQPALYRDPKSGATWSGRGPAPAWLAGAKDRAKFLIDGAAASAAAANTSVPKVEATKAVAKKAAVKKVVAKKATAKKVAAKKATVKAAAVQVAPTAEKTVTAKEARAKKSPAASKKAAAKKTSASPAKKTSAAPAKKAAAKKLAEAAVKRTTARKVVAKKAAAVKESASTAVVAAADVAVATGA